MEAPEKIYIMPHTLTDGFCHRWFEESFKIECIEYTRTDAFIEKACEWLSINMKMLMNVLDVEYDTHDTDIKDFIEDFKKYIED